MTDIKYHHLTKSYNVSLNSGDIIKVKLEETVLKLQLCLTGNNFDIF